MENSIFVSVAGASLHVQDTGGEEPAVLFSHGNLMNNEMWAPQREALGSAFRVITWDVRLHGRTEDDGSVHSYWDSARDALAILDALEIQRAALVGHSQGGFIGLRAALLAPERVSALALIDSTSQAWPAPALEQMGAVRDGFAAGGADAVADVLPALLLADPELEARWVAAWRKQRPARLAAAVSMLMGVDDVTDRLAEIGQPALLVHGEHDQPIPNTALKVLNDGLPKVVQTLVVPNAGHTPSLTHPDAVNAVLVPFLRDHA